MSNNIYPVTAPICAIMECTNHVKRSAGTGSKWSIYCCRSCAAYARGKIRSDRIAKEKESYLAPLCACPGCINIPDQSPKKYKIPKYKKFCSSICRKKYLLTEQIRKNDNKKEELGTAPNCSNDNCNNIVSLKAYRGAGWSNFCCLTCRNTHNSRINKEKRKNTWENKSEDELRIMMKKQKKSSYRRKIYVFPSGRIAKMQGNEPIALDNLLLSHNEDDIMTESDSIPIIKYIGIDNRYHYYHPDIYIPKDNTIIEVKSEWTYNLNVETNLLKEKACIAAGFNFRWMIY